MTTLEAKLDAELRSLPIWRPGDGRLSYKSTIPGIVRQLALMKRVKHEAYSAEATKKKLISMKKHADALYKDLSAMVSLPMHWRVVVASIAHAEIPDLPPRAGRGRPVKNLAPKVARITAEHFFGLTGHRPTRITPSQGGKARGLFIKHLAMIYEILGIEGSAENQAKAAIKFVNNKYPKK